MKTVHITTTASLVHADTIAAAEQQLQAECAQLQAVIAAADYRDPRASVSLPSDTALAAKATALAKQYAPLDLLIVVGIGGSNLGTMAIHEALHGKFHGAFRAPSIYFADTVDAEQLRDLTKIMELFLQYKKTIVLNLISKSGSTTETIANFEVLYAVLAKHIQTPQKQVVVTTDEGSPLWTLATQQGFALLPIPKQVGGRYSVFSPVGIFPLAALGVDVEQLLAGARAMRDRCVQSHDNPAMQTAAIHAYHCTHGRNIADLFLFSTDLESCGKWYRQLLGESIGKEWNRNHTKQVHVGITPTVSIGSTDLHSVGQLYLGGPQDKFTTFVTLAHAHDVHVPNLPVYEQLVPHIQGKPLHHIMQAIVAGVQQSYIANDRPFYTIELPEKSAYALGQLFQLQMMQMMYLSVLLDVDPFDQPNVESYKIETKKILKTT
jgi:glucose-6-phosphate isomerase